MYKIHGASVAMSSTAKKNLKISSSISISFERCYLAFENWKMRQIGRKFKVCHFGYKRSLELYDPQKDLDDPLGIATMMQVLK